MFSEINARLVKIQLQLRKKAKYQMQLDDFIKELETIQDTQSQLQLQFESEKNDVAKLERMGLTNLIATLSGKKEEKRSKEKQEMLAVQLKLEEAEKTINEIEGAIKSLHDHLANLENVESEYQQLLHEKELAIKSSHSHFADKLFELSEREGQAQAYSVELEEAISAGEKVKNALMDAINSLESAASWGTFDMFGGGTLSGMVKHSHIDEAEEALHRAQSRMRHFQKELLDVQTQAELTIDISGMLRFADFFFDGFIVDYMVQGKINDSLDETKDQHAKVSTILQKLNSELEEKKLELESILKEKLEIVEGL